MATVFDVAKYILQQKGEMSTWKLQKLCYYSQAWAIAWTGKPLFDEDFEAWRNGPVCRALYNVHRGMYSVGERDIYQGDPERLTSDERDTIDTVLATYGDWALYRLRSQTHSEDPWKNARGDLDDMASCRRVITKESMNAYYGEL